MTATLTDAALDGLARDLVRSFKDKPVPTGGNAVAVYRDLSGAPKSGYPAHTSWSVKTVNAAGNRHLLRPRVRPRVPHQSCEGR